MDRSPSEAVVNFFDFDTRRFSLVGSIDKPLSLYGTAISASRDGRWIIWSQLDHTDSNLMMIENFRWNKVSG